MKGPRAAASTAEHPQGRATFVRYTKGSTAMMTDPPASGNTQADEIRDAAWNAVAVASIHWQQSVNTLRHILVTASDHGLTMDELVVASGIQRANIIRVLADGRDL